AAMVAGITALGEVVLFGEAFEVGAGNIVEQQIVAELKERSELVFDIVLDGNLPLEQARERAIETVLRDERIGHTQEFLQGGGRVPMFGQGEFAARLAQAIDDFD